MTAAVSVGRRRGRRLRRDLLWPKPEAWAWVGVGCAWLVLASPAVSDPARLLGGAHAHAPLDVVAHPAVMAVAMMVPLALPSARYVGESSLWRRRHRSIALFLASYVAAWTAAGAVLTAVAGIASPAPRRAVVGVAFGVAVAHQLSAGQLARLRSCQRTFPLAPEGRDADLDCLRFGTEVGRACIASCWAAMAAATAAHGVVAMAAVLAISLDERRTWRLTRGVQVRAALLLGLVGLLVIAASPG
jgi:predicted metal-binding membrane protein